MGSVVMVDEQDVRRIALSLPETSEDPDRPRFLVLDKAFAWCCHERIDGEPARVPRSDVFAVRVAGLAEKETLLAADPGKFFSEPHYNGYPAVLLRLPQIGVDELGELVVEAWRCRAPAGLVAQFDGESGVE
jgi:hypothetical protein